MPDDPKVVTGFRRALVGELQNSKIRSTCVYCGFTIVASVSDGLPDREAEHLRACPQAAKAKGTS
jgi:hypothetical protein